jgi:hypothetical protein
VIEVRFEGTLTPVGEAPTERVAGQQRHAHRARAAAWLLDLAGPTSRSRGLSAAGVLALALLWPAGASAGTYPMYQCGEGTTVVAPGWSAFGYTTLASTVVSNSCGAGGPLGVYVFSSGQPGAVTENGDSGSSVGLSLQVPASAPGVTIQSVAAKAVVSPVSGDDAWLEFAAAGQQLPGGAELPYGSSSPYTASEQWTLPGGARGFEAYVNCSTDNSSTTCEFPDSNEVPGLQDMTIILADNAPPSLSNISGTLASAAAAGATVSGAQTLTFQATDPDAGVRTVTVTLTPAAGGPPFVDTIDYSSRCAYDSWNACPLSQNGSATINASALAEDTYAVGITVTDAAGNTDTVDLGSITTKTAPHLPNGTPCAGPQIALTLDGRRKPARVRYGRRVEIAGLLHCKTTPIAGALLDVTGGGISTLVQTGSQGRFRYLVPVGPSRTLTVAYRAYSDAAGPAALARARIGVYPVLSLSITPRITINGGTIVWRGEVAGGPYPRDGLTLLVQVKAGRRWQTFDQLLTHNGSFEYAYTFRRTTRTTTYPFRIALPASGAAGYHYLSAASRTIKVKVRA